MSFRESRTVCSRINRRVKGFVMPPHTPSKSVPAGAAPPRSSPVGHQSYSALACASRVSASLTLNSPGPSTLSVLTTPSLTSIE